MNICFPFKLLLAVTLAFSSVITQAEEVLISVDSQSSELITSSVPTHGQTMTEVLQHLGQPEISDTVGTPPISRWSYPDKNMTIYFEGTRVLHSVIYHYSAH